MTRGMLEYEKWFEFVDLYNANNLITGMLQDKDCGSEEEMRFG